MGVRGPWAVSHPVQGRLLGEGLILHPTFEDSARPGRLPWWMVLKWIRPTYQHNLGACSWAAATAARGFGRSTVSTLQQRHGWEVDHLALNTQTRGFWPVANAFSAQSCSDAQASREDVQRTSVMYRFKNEPRARP